MHTDQPQQMPSSIAHGACHTTPILCAEGLQLQFGTSAILKDIDLAVHPGDVLGLVGRNGAGKSSLLRCLVGLTPPSSGRARLFGQDSLHLPDAARERLGYVSQQADLLGWLDVWSHVQTIGAFYPRWREARARRLCDRLELPLRTRTDKLSGGEQQKLSLVLAMAHDPDLLILDEPVASLDPLARRDFMRLLFDTDAQADPDAIRQREHPHPRSVVISSHLLQDLERVVTHLVCLDKGRVVLNSPWDRLQEDSGQPMEDLFVQLSAPSLPHTAAAANTQEH